MYEADTNCSNVVQVCKYLRFSGVSVPQEYEVGFQRALWTFRWVSSWIIFRIHLAI